MLYDADCGFCRWALGWVLRADRRRWLAPLPLGSAQADELLAELSPAQRAASWHLVAPDGRRWSAGPATARLVGLLPGGRIPAHLLDSAPALTARAYRWVADHRAALSRLIPARSKARADGLISSRTKG